MKSAGTHFLVCPDAELLHQEMAGRLSGSKTDIERHVYWGDDDPPLTDDFWTNLTIKGLFAQPKALIVRRAQNLKAADWDKLGPALPSPGSDVALFLCLEGAWNKGKPAVPAVLSKRPAWTKTPKERIWQSPGLTRQTVAKFVRDFAQKRGLDFAPGGLEAVAGALPLDARAAALELDKIALAASASNKGDGSGGGTITPAHADLVMPHDEMDFFAFLDGLQTGRAEAVWQRVLADHLKPTSDRMLFPLLSAVGREARQLALLATGQDHHVRLPGFVLDKKRGLARRLGPKGAAAIIELAVEAEAGVKSGERRPEQALEMLVAGLMRLYAPSSPAPR